MPVKKTKKNSNAAEILIKPVGKFGGLDNIHIALIALVVIMAAILIVSNYFEQPSTSITSNTSSTCAYGSLNGTCISPIHTSAQVKSEVENYLANYASSNTSLSVLPFISNTSQMGVSYIPAEKEWYVEVPFKEPGSPSQYYFSAIVSDKNISDIVPYIETSKPASSGNNTVVGYGVVRLGSEAIACNSTNITSVYWFVDPYAPGSIPSLNNFTQLRSRFGSRINASIKILFTQYSQQVANSYGVQNADQLGEYVLCASVQPGFGSFEQSLNRIYTGSYISKNELASIANDSGLNNTQINTCLQNATTTINFQHDLAQHYDVIATPEIVTACKYLSIPQTASYSVCYADPSACAS